MINAEEQMKLQIAKFASLREDQTLDVNDAQRPIHMVHSDGTGEPLVKNGKFGADVIRFAAGEGVMNHTHEGDHILFVLKGNGIVEYNGEENPLYPGLCYLIPGSVDHAIRAHENLVLIAVGNDHRPLDSETRLDPVYK